MQHPLASLYAIVPLAALGAFFSPAVLADGGHAAHAGHGAAAAAAPASLTDGTVKKVDKSAGKLTLSHGPLENLGMPGMTMSFAVKDSAWLDKYKAGDKLRFQADYINGTYTVVRVDTAK